MYRKIMVTGVLLSICLLAACGKEKEASFESAGYEKFDPKAVSAETTASEVQSENASSVAELESDSIADADEEDVITDEDRTSGNISSSLTAFAEDEDAVNSASDVASESESTEAENDEKSSDSESEEKKEDVIAVEGSWSEASGGERQIDISKTGDEYTVFVTSKTELGGTPKQILSGTWDEERQVLTCKDAIAASEQSGEDSEDKLDAGTFSCYGGHLIWNAPSLDIAGVIFERA